MTGDMITYQFCISFIIFPDLF